MLALATAEAAYTDALVETMATFQPSRGCSLSPVLRGLVMKNKKLSTMLDNYKQECDLEAVDTLDIFKVFVNNFLLWLDSDYLTLLRNYATALFRLDQPLDMALFAKPIRNCNNYVRFVDSCIESLRNPFVVETMAQKKSELVQIVKTFESEYESQIFSLISFENVQSYGGDSATVDKVSSFFSLEHIVQRSGNDKFYLTHDKKQVACELVLLDFTNMGLNNYNALAILQVPTKHGEPRSLIFPPFRVNELSACLSNSKIVLKPIDFVSVYDSPKFNENVCELVLESIEPKLLIAWFKKLSNIFPVDRSSSPIREKLINSANSSPVKMSGLGINVLSDNNTDEEISLGSPSFIKSNKSFADEHSSTSPLSQLQQKFDKGGAANGFGSNSTIHDLQPPMLFSKAPRSNSFSDSSLHSIDSTQSQQDRANNLMAKTLSNNSLSHLESLIQSVNKLSLDKEDVSSKHHSAVAPIEYASPDGCFGSAADNLTPEVKNESVFQQPYPSRGAHFASVPDLTDKKASLYKLNDGSEIDITNFGKSHVPSFASQSMADLSELPKSAEATKKKSFFGMFSKKSKDTSKKPKTASKSNQTSKPKPVTKSANKSTTAKTSQLSTIEDKKVEKTPSPIKTESTPADPISAKNFSLPSPFAIPNSDSMYFVKSRAGSSASLAHDANSPAGDATDLHITQELKDLINNSEDFYVSPTETELRVSRWRSKSGQWVMLAADSHKMWLKISVNFALNRSWIIVFKETLEIDALEGEEQVVDKPILLLEINDQTMLRRSGALDLQVQTLNPIINERMLVIIRSKSGSFIDELHSMLNDSVSQITGKIRASARSMAGSRMSSKSTLNSMADIGLTSNSTTLTSINSSVFDRDAKMKALSPYKENTSLLVDQIDNFDVINKTTNNKLILLNEMPIRLQKQLESYESISNPSTWQIISMYSLTIFLVSDMETNTDYYNLELKNLADDGKPDFNWLIESTNIWNRFQRLGKAGLLVNSSANEYYMLECKGKKQFKTLMEIF